MITIQIIPRSQDLTSQDFPSYPTSYILTSSLPKFGKLRDMPKREYFVNVVKPEQQIAPSPV